MMTRRFRRLDKTPMPQVPPDRSLCATIRLRAGLSAHPDQWVQTMKVPVYYAPDIEASPFVQRVPEMHVHLAAARPLVTVRRRGYTRRVLVGVEWLSTNLPEEWTAYCAFRLQAAVTDPIGSLQ